MSNMLSFNSKDLLKKTSSKKNITIVVIAVIVILLFVTSIFLLRFGIRKGKNSLNANFEAVLEDEKQLTYDKWYNFAYQQAQENYHVQNSASISIGNIKEQNNLEILKVNDVEFITINADENSGHLTSWIEAEGEGTFIVNLQSAEFIIDNEHNYVLARIPLPELINIKLIRTESKLLKNGLITNGSFSDGVHTAVAQNNEAQRKIEQSLISNQYFFNTAKDVSKSIIQNLVKQLNPAIPNIIVDVEFMN